MLRLQLLLDRQLFRQYFCIQNVDFTLALRDFDSRKERRQNKTETHQNWSSSKPNHRCLLLVRSYVRSFKRWSSAVNLIRIDCWQSFFFIRIFLFVKYLCFSSGRMKIVRPMATDILSYIWSFTSYKISERIKYSFSSEEILGKTSYGPVKGFKTTSSAFGYKYISFLGIPYAKPPVGELRFKVGSMINWWSVVKLRDRPNFMSNENDNPELSF